jgi:hypothetical protein
MRQGSKRIPRSRRPDRRAIGSEPESGPATDAVSRSVQSKGTRVFRSVAGGGGEE